MGLLESTRFSFGLTGTVAIHSMPAVSEPDTGGHHVPVSSYSKDRFSSRDRDLNDRRHQRTCRKCAHVACTIGPLSRSGQGQNINRGSEKGRPTHFLQLTYL